MLKIIRSFKELYLKALKAGNNEVVGGGSNKADKMIVDSSKFKNNKFEKLMHIPNIGAIRKPSFLTSNNKKIFNHLRPIFIKALILQHFDPECHIRIETNALSYIPSKVLSQLNLDSNTSLNDSNLNKSDFG